MRSITGPLATEIYLHGRPPLDKTDPRAQAAALYRAVDDLLRVRGGSLASVTAETVFLRDVRADLADVRHARSEALATCGATSDATSITEIGQPPLDQYARLEVGAHAVVPRGGSAPSTVRVTVESDCPCPGCARTQGVVVRLGAETRFHAAGLSGAGASAHEQTLAMFRQAEKLLQRAGLEFRDVVRTWIYLRHMERDYPLLNRARREFFAARRIAPVPASTGICGTPPAEAHDLCMAVHAVRPVARTVMTSPTLNEAGEYGADFVRGMKVFEANKVALHVSGTASIDEHGSTAHAGDFDAQAGRMLVNVAALLERQGAGFGDVVSAVTYLKHREHAQRLRQKLAAVGFNSFPHVIVEAGICRPDLLCETEAVAVLPG